MILVSSGDPQYLIIIATIVMITLSRGTMFAIQAYLFLIKFSVSY
jgi:hypothetical protein